MKSLLGLTKKGAPPEAAPNAKMDNCPGFFVFLDGSDFYGSACTLGFFKDFRKTLFANFGEEIPFTRPVHKFCALAGFPFPFFFDVAKGFFTQFLRKA